MSEDNHDSPKLNILVIGATGLQGQAACRRLLENGFRVSGLTRTADSAAAIKLAGEGVAMIQGDLANTDEIRAAMKDTYGVFAVFDPMTHGAEGEYTQAVTSIDAAIHAQVKHFVYSSVGSPDADNGVAHFDSKWRVEQYLKKTPLQWTILRPTSFMEDLTEKKFVPPVLWHVWSKVSGWGTSLQWVAVDDIAQAVVSVLKNKTNTLGKTYTLVGDRCSLRQAEEMFAAVRGKKPSRVPMPVWLFRRMISEDLYRLFWWYRKQGFNGDPAELQKLVTSPKNMQAWLGTL